jgi:hypothetical protein
MEKFARLTGDQDRILSSQNRGRNKNILKSRMINYDVIYLLVY